MFAATMLSRVPVSLTVARRLSISSVSPSHFAEVQRTLSARNLAGVTILPSGRLTARDVMNTTRIIATEAAILRLQEVLG